MDFCTEVCKVLGIEQPIERRQKPELLNKGQNCYLCLEETNGQPDYKANKDKLNNKIKQSAFPATIPLALNTYLQLVMGALKELMSDFTF